MKMSKTSFQG